MSLSFFVLLMQKKRTKKYNPELRDALLRILPQVATCLLEEIACYSAQIEGKEVKRIASEDCRSLTSLDNDSIAIAGFEKITLFKCQLLETLGMIKRKTIPCHQLDFASFRFIQYFDGHFFLSLNSMTTILSCDLNGTHQESYTPFQKSSTNVNHDGMCIFKNRLYFLWHQLEIHSYLRKGIVTVCSIGEHGKLKTIQHWEIMPFSALDLCSSRLVVNHNQIYIKTSEEVLVYSLDGNYVNRWTAKFNTIFSLATDDFSDLVYLFGPKEVEEWDSNGNFVRKWSWNNNNDLAVGDPVSSVVFRFPLCYIMSTGQRIHVLR